MAVVSTMILRSMRMINEKPRGGTLNATEQTETLQEFNSFLDAMPIERLNCYSVQQDSFALTASTNSYTIGTNGVFNVTRPVKIIDPCFVRDASNFDTPVKVIGSDSYGKIVMKQVGYTYPTHLFYDHGFSNTSTGTIYLYPSPTAGLTLYINSWKQIGTVLDVSTNMLLPPGYQLFIESNFAIHLAAGFRPVPPETAKIARDSRAAIKSLNIPEANLRIDSGALQKLGPKGSILTGP